MENLEGQYAVETSALETDEYNLIKGSLDISKNPIAGIMENEQNSNYYYDEESKKLLSDMYAFVHSTDSSISSQDKLEILKKTLQLLMDRKNLTETTMKEATKRMNIIARHDTLRKVGEIAEKLITVAVPLIQQYLDQKNKPWWKKILGK